MSISKSRDEKLDDILKNPLKWVGFFILSYLILFHFQ
jgi:hypothetical protein